VHPFVYPASRCTYRFTGHVNKVYVSDSNQIMVAYWSVFGDFSRTLYVCISVILCKTVFIIFPVCYLSTYCYAAEFIIVKNRYRRWKK